MIKLNCKICGSSLLEEIKVENEKYYRCKTCDFIFVDERYLVSKEEELAKYELHENTIENEGYVKMFEKFIDEAVKPFAESPKRILEFGSGPGPVLAELLRRKGHEVEIYDVYYAPDKPKGFFDIITSTEVFEHFINPIKDIEFILSLMKKGAYLSIMTNFHPEKNEDFAKWWYHRDYTHISFYSTKTFEFIASKYDLEYIYNNEKNVSVFRKK